MIGRYALVAALAVSVVATSGASATTGWRQVLIERHAGVVQANLFYEARPDPHGGSTPQFRDGTLVVRRHGKTLIVRRIAQPFHNYPSIKDYGQVRIRLRNVWGDREPEVLVETYACGNRCGVQLYVATTTEHKGSVAFHDFDGGWSGPYAWAGQWRQGRFYFLSYDQRFFCTFASCCCSYQPRRVFALDSDGRHLVDVTRTRLDAIEAQAANIWKEYLREREHPIAPQELQGDLAAWCADQYLLGRRARCEHALREAKARRYLPPHFAQSFIDSLHRKLAAWGYR